MIQKIKKIKESRLPKHILETSKILLNLNKEKINDIDFLFKFNNTNIIKSMFKIDVIFVNEKLFTGYNENELNDIYTLIKNILGLNNNIKIIRQISL